MATSSNIMNIDSFLYMPEPNGQIEIKRKATNPSESKLDEPSNDEIPTSIEDAKQEFAEEVKLTPNETQDSKEESMAKSLTTKALRPFVIISSSYLLFTITDGAIRMIVLLHAYNEGFSALEVSVMFMLYELAGVFTNLAAGLMGAKWGIKLTLVCGLALQIFSYGLLFGWNPDWDKKTAIVYVTIAQMFAGIAKDLTKLGGKTVTKLVTPEDKQTRLFQLVSLITGMKNSLKGVGYFLGSVLVARQYELALFVMIGFILLAMPWAILGLDSSLGTAKKKNANWTQVFKMDNRNLNFLSLARLFLFASRDFWFEVPLPFYLRSPTCEGLGDICQLDTDCSSGAFCGESGLCENFNVGGGCGGVGLARYVVGGFLGGYIILYGQVQSWTPQLVTNPLNQTPPNKYTEMLWGAINCFPTAAMAIVMATSTSFQTENTDEMIVWLIVLVVTFAIIFAINSSIHSFLVVKYAKADKVAVSVGFYYMSNALGRLFGTIGSGVLFTFVGEYKGPLAGIDGTMGLIACFIAGTISSLLAVLITVFIEDEDAGLRCGSLVCVDPINKEEPEEA